jgi:hypothetical protein
MPPRMIDFDSLWASGRIARCASWAQAEYAWLYGLADAYGCFELTNSRVLWGKVAAVRKNLPLERLEQILAEFHEKGLLFIWEENGKRYGHWTNSHKKGRLPGPSHQCRYSRTSPPVPEEQLKIYLEKTTPNYSLPETSGISPETSREGLVREGKERDGKGYGETKTAQASPSQSLSHFDEFWKTYPRKEAKPRAVKAAKKIAVSEWPKIIADIAQRKLSENWNHEGGRFIPHPATYLNERRWEDTPVTQELKANEGTPELEALPWRSRD